MSHYSAEYVETVTTLQTQIERIRNISIIAHVDHGKTTLCDFLLAKAGVISYEDAGEKHAIASSKQEKERQITIKSIGISLPFKKDDKQYIVNLVDSPGHVDFSSEVTAALRITDGAIVVVDCVEGVCVQTETVTRQALTERIKPVLHINKIDRGIMELHLTGEQLYQKFNQLIENVNVLLSTYQDATLGALTVDPRHGSVSFGSGKQGWAFTLPQMARMLSEKSKQDINNFLPYLWGDHFFDPETKRITNKPISKSGKPLERYVVHTILNPIINIFNSIKKNEMDTLSTLLSKIGIKLSEKEKNEEGSRLIKSIMQKWLPAADALVSMIIDHLPSPNLAQRYRVENLYTGPLDDEFANAIRNCDPEGPLMMFVSKMIDLEGDGKRYHAFGRVFSGTVRPGQEVFIMGPNYVVGEPTDFAVKKIPGTVLIMGSKIEPVMQVPCGNTVGLPGLEHILIKSGTISSSPTAHPISPMKFSVSPVVRRAVSPQNQAQLKKFTKALKRLEKSDPCLLVLTTKGGEFIIAGAGELHIEVALGELKKILQIKSGDEIGFTVSPPVVGFCETVCRKSTLVCLGKSPNKHNRLKMTAEPLGNELTTFLEQGKLELKDSQKMIKQLVEDFGWDKNEASKIWFFVGSNCLVDSSHGVQYLNEIKDHVRSALEEIVQQSVLCKEPMRGVRFNLMDAHLHSDAIHRGPGQIAPTAVRLFLAAVLSADPRLVEPVYSVDIQTEQTVVGKIYSCVAQRRGVVENETPRPGTPLVQVKARLPVAESFGFAAELREATSGRAFPQLLFDHWQVVPGDLSHDSLPLKMVMEVRKRKGLKLELPVVEDYNDKL